MTSTRSGGSGSAGATGGAASPRAASAAVAGGGSSTAASAGASTTSGGAAAAASKEAEEEEARASSTSAEGKDAKAGGQLRSSPSSGPRLQPQPRHRLGDASGDKVEPLQGFKFSFLCLSGVDDSVSPRTLCDISQEFSFVEWGVNFRAEKQGKEPRYASLAWLRQLREEIDRRQQTGKFTPIHFAAHLGGEYCVDVMKGDASLVRTLWEDYGFLRVQLSPTRAHGVNSAQLRKYLASLKSVIIALPQVEFVLEVTKETRGLSFALMDEPQPNLAFLFSNDELAPTTPAATTAGSEAASSSSACPSRPPPCPHPGIHVGYGGSLVVDNLREELKRIAATVNDPKRPVWVDLESGLRSQGPGKHDEFDLGKVWACIRIIFDLGLPRPRPSYAAR